MYKQEQQDSCRCLISQLIFPNRVYVTDIDQLAENVLLYFKIYGRT